MIVEGVFEKKIVDFIVELNSSVQDIDQQHILITKFSKKLEEEIIELVKSISITLPIGSIRVTDGTTISTNIEPIILDNIVK